MVKTVKDVKLQGNVILVMVMASVIGVKALVNAVSAQCS